jgi:hypothetical protein
MERNTIAASPTDRNEAKITLTRLPDRAGVVGAGARSAREAGIAVDMIVQAGQPGGRGKRHHLHGPDRIDSPGDGRDRGAQG